MSWRPISVDQKEVVSMNKSLVGFTVLVCFLVVGSVPAFAKERRGNPPGPAGGPGAGPRWKDNPHKIDNPPGPIGGRGTDWPKYRHHRNAEKHLAKLTRLREKMVAKGASSEKIAKIDAKIQKLQTKLPSGQV